MSWLYRHCVRPLLFTQDPEQIHLRTLATLGRVARHRGLLRILERCCHAPDLPTEVFGLRFPNPIGLAAGMDKDAEALTAWAAMGFGFTELGAITWLAQPGNPPPRIFRVKSDEALINRMGFNNVGASAMAERLRGWKSAGLWPSHPVGVNLGKSKVTALGDAPADYANTFRALRGLADFFVVNVSSPNTPNLRQLQDRSALEEILAAIQQVQLAAGSPMGGRSEPILIKVAPDLSLQALDEIVEVAQNRAVAGLIATNTTITRPEHPEPRVAQVYRETGGLSGRPLRARSTEVIRHLYRQTQGRLPVIGVGGIFNAADAWEKIVNGACLLQIYTGLVYEGPGLPRRLVKGIRQRLQAEGLSALHQAVGLAMR